jgi:hypothetical protein
MTGSPPQAHGPADSDAAEVVSLNDAVTHALDEARMLLPGMQALFGFQLIAVFSARFESALDATQQRVHLAALLLIGIAIALTMTPAAYHRQTEPSQVSAELLAVASWFVSAALWPLGVGLCADIFVVAQLILHDIRWSITLTALLALLLGGLWFALPRIRRGRHARG